MTVPIYLIRHGRTAGNLEHRYVGVTDEPLCEEGLRELQVCRMRLRECFHMDHVVMPEKVYVSPMLRCRQSAMQLFPDAELCFVEDFREMDFGEFEYKNYAALKGDARYQAYIDSGGNKDFPKGETQAHFRNRVKEAFKQCVTHIYDGYEASVTDKSEEPYVFCVHGGTIMALLDAYSVPHEDYFHWQLPNASGFRAALEVKKNGIYLKKTVRFL